MTLSEVMYPSSLRTWATPRLSLLFRQRTDLALLRAALRMRVSMSEVRSCWDISYSGIEGELPTGFPHAGNHALQREFAQHDAADAELAVHAARAAGQLAAVAVAS